MSTLYVLCFYWNYWVNLTYPPPRCYILLAFCSPWFNISSSIYFGFWCLSEEAPWYILNRKDKPNHHVQCELIFETLYGCVLSHAWKKQWKEIPQNVTSNNFGVFFPSLPICIFLVFFFSLFFFFLAISIYSLWNKQIYNEGKETKMRRGR